jgi:hypothetical protein
MAMSVAVRGYEIDERKEAHVQTLISPCCTVCADVQAKTNLETDAQGSDPWLFVKRV